MPHRTALFLAAIGALLACARADKPQPTGPRPAFGGRAIVHLEAMPRSLNAALDNSAVQRRILYELSETLLLRDWDSCELKPDLCQSYEVEDAIVRKDGRRERAGAKVPAEEIDRVEHGTVFTFHLRSGVRWHDGHPFNAEDVRFSWSIYQNPKINCDDLRATFVNSRCEVLDPLTVRFWYDKQYFVGLSAVGDMPLLPRHLYDLRDPDNLRADPEYHAARKAKDPDWKPSDDDEALYVNQNPHNRAFVGLGPYKLESWDGDVLVARRFEGYFAPENSGFLDELRWRYVKDDAVALQALLNGELDFYARLSTADYFAESTASPAFTEHFVKGHYSSAAYGFIAWNMWRPKLADVRVRTALAHAFDAEGFKNAYYKGLATQVTGHFAPDGPNYDASIQPLAYDPALARSLFAEAGWSEHDQDGWLVKDGQRFELVLLSNSGNDSSEKLALALQADLAKIGIKLELQLIEWNQTKLRAQTRDFDGLLMGWVPAFETDPEQAFHSRWGAPDKRGSNYSGLQDAEVDRLIESGQREVDSTKRSLIWRALQARLFALQPYLWCFNPPRKYAITKALCGFQPVRIDPNYVLRRWYYAAGTPGTRSTRTKS